MVHFPGLAHTRLCIQRAVSECCSEGFPHSEIPGSMPACGSPGLIAACHVLHRLLAPRHPPYALSSLIIKLTQSVVVRPVAQAFRPEAFRPSFNVPIPASPFFLCRLPCSGRSLDRSSVKCNTGFRFRSPRRSAKGSATSGSSSNL
jgi:hypothetical protein